MVCYSPIGKSNRDKGEFWGHIYVPTMKSKKEGAINMIGEMLDQAEDFVEKE